MAVCGRCGEDNPARARFCLACGSELADVPSQRRKTITVLFADVVDSTGLGEHLDPEALRSVMDRFFACAQRAVDAHGGTVEKFIGDAVMAVFGIPQAHEDDALRAVRAAVDIQKGVAALNEDAAAVESIAVRVGINTGEVLTVPGGDGRTGVVGDPVNAAARLEKLAQPGGVILGTSTHQLVRGAVTTEPMGPLNLRGKAGSVDAHILLAVDPPAGPGRTLGAPLVGRAREMDALRHAYQRVSEDKVCLLFTLLGPAGIGKSRLVAELVATTVDDPRVLTGRCLPYGDGITFWPITEVISEAAHISDRDSQDDALRKLRSLLGDDEDRDLIANLVGQVLGLGPSTASQEEIFWAIRKVFDSLATQGPLVLVFDDIHWGEETFLDLIDSTVEAIGEAPILMLCVARPELLEIRPTWSGGKVNAATMLLEPLREGESKELFAGLLGDASAIQPLLGRILEVSGGNPLFLEETVSMLVDEGVITKAEGRWETRGDVAEITIPPTINALLTARLDQLPGDERSAIELAAVMGKVFAAQAVRDLNDSDADVLAALGSLTRKGLIRLAQEEFAGEEQYRFRHLLIRDAAYHGIPKERRADLHERYAGWLVEVLAERATEYEEIIGYHLEFAFKYRTELGLGARELAALRAQGAKRLSAAGKRATDRGDTAAAANLLQRTMDLLDPSDPLRLEVGSDWATALIENGEYVDAELLLTGLIEQAQRLGNRRAEVYARLQLEESHVHSLPQVSNEKIRELSEKAIETFEELNDDAGQAYGLRLLAFTYDSLGHSSEARRAYERALHHAEASGDSARAIRYRRFLMQSISWGPMTADDLIPLAEEYLQWSENHSELRSEAQAAGILCYAHAMKGHFDQAQEYSDRREAIYENLQLELLKAWSVFESSAINVLQGKFDEAERQLRLACEICERKKEQAVLPTIVALLADVSYELGNLGEAETLARRAEQLGAHDDFLTQIKWRTVRAKVLAHTGDHEVAESLAREAVSLAARTDYIDWHANAVTDLARVLTACNKPADARAALDDAMALYEAKGFTSGASQARSLLASLTT